MRMIIGEFASELFLNLLDIMAVAGWYFSRGSSHLETGWPNKAPSELFVSSVARAEPLRGWFIPNWSCRGRGDESCVLVKPLNRTARGAALHGENYAGLFLWVQLRFKSPFGTNLSFRCHIPTCFLAFANCFLPLRELKIEGLCHPCVCVCWWVSCCLMKPGNFLFNESLNNFQLSDQNDNRKVDK